MPYTPLSLNLQRRVRIKAALKKRSRIIPVTYICLLIIVLFLLIMIIFLLLKPPNHLLLSPPAWPFVCRQVPQAPHVPPQVTWKSYSFAGTALSGLSPSRKPGPWALGFSEVTAASAPCRHRHCCCCKRQQLSLLDLPGNLRQCYRTRPRQNPGLLDSRTIDLGAVGSPRWHQPRSR